MTRAEVADRWRVIAGDDADLWAERVWAVEVHAQPYLPDEVWSVHLALGWIVDGHGAVKGVSIDGVREQVRRAVCVLIDDSDIPPDVAVQPW